ncbi:MAG TPA: carboxypeptidase regulatory-like domain-containing protein [Vicinamibacterales bacterium]|nr:carboxypeptidase regulatory-like domain-containing protein [Vicinamibacterales bacterium]
MKLVVALLSSVGLAIASADGGGRIEGTVKATGLPSSADAVVYVLQIPGKFPAPAKPAEMDQRSMQFIPRVLPIVVGTTVRFLNSDPTQHNVFSPDHEKYNLGTWPQGQTKDHVFGTCAKAPCTYVQLCRIHPEMEAYIVVLQNPFFAVTTSDGKYKIDNVPPGAYSLGVWHPKQKAQPKPVTVDASKPAAVDFVLAK